MHFVSLVVYTIGVQILGSNSPSSSVAPLLVVTVNAVEVSGSCGTDVTGSVTDIAVSSVVSGALVAAIAVPVSAEGSVTAAGKVTPSVGVSESIGCNFPREFGENAVLEDEFPADSSVVAEVVTAAGVVLPVPFTVLTASAGDGDESAVCCLWLESHAKNSSSVDGIFL